MARLDVHDVTVRFGGVTAVDAVTLGAGPGEVTGLIGPNGAGKTTLFNVVTGLQRPSAGTVHFEGEDITRSGTHERARRGIARTFQRLEAFGSLNVRENVLVAADIQHRWRRRRSRVDALLDRVGLTPFADQQADTIPTGIARLLELARALAIEPRVLLLDEPSSGLNATETESFGGLLRELAAEGRAVLVVEHDMDLIMRFCDRVHVLDFGQVIASDAPEKVRSNGRVQRAYLGHSPTDPAEETAEVPS